MSPTHSFLRRLFYKLCAARQRSLCGLHMYCWVVVLGHVSQSPCAVGFAAGAIASGVAEELYGLEAAEERLAEIREQRHGMLDMRDSLLRGPPPLPTNATHGGNDTGISSNSSHQSVAS